MIPNARRRPVGRPLLLILVLALVGAFLSAAATPAAAQGSTTAPPRTLYVSPQGSGQQCDSAAPCAISDAQQLVRTLAPSMTSDIKVELAGGTYRLSTPLRFDASDSGRNGYTVSWVAAPGATPVFSGGARIGGWTPSPGSATVWQARVPANVSIDPRELYVDGVLATRARTRISRSDIAFTANGIDITSPALAYLNNIKQQDRVVMEFVNSFTDRFSPVPAISGNHMTMAQPAWDNNTWGYDTVQHPFRSGPVYIENAREFLDSPGEWYFDPQTRTLYYQPLPGQDMNGLDVELPRLQSLLQIGGSYADPAHNLTFSGIRFSDTTWTAPDGAYGYASQQTAAFAYSTGERPDDAFTSCAVGCSGFESTRNTWHQAPAAVQVSAANNVTLSDNVYTNIGSVSVGVGEDANANDSGVGLGASDIQISNSRFFNSAGGGVVVGGVQPDAHHPSDPRMTNHDITISDNVVHDVSQEYQDQDGILFTYVTRAIVTHNEVYDLPYSGIGSGWGWGTNDPGGSQDYVNRGLYNYQPIYQTPTTATDDVVSYNFIHDYMRTMNDGAAFYNLSASPGSVAEQNYFLAPSKAAVYFDEGSRYWTVRQNVYRVSRPGILNANSTNNTGNITYTDNWLIGASDSSLYGRGNVVTGTVVLSASDPVPVDAARVIYNSGVSLPLRAAPDPQRPPLAIALKAGQSQLDPGGSSTLTATLTNLDPTHPVTDIEATLATPAGWTANPQSGPTTVAADGSATATFTVTAPSTASKPIDAAAITASVGYAMDGVSFTGTGSLTLITAVPVTSLRTYGSVPSTFGALGNTYAIRNAGADIWGAGGQNDDAYGVIYAPGAAHDGSVITVHVDAEDAVDPWTKAGIVLRNDVTQPKQSQGYVALVVTPSNGVNLDWDSNGDGLLDQFIAARGIKAPVWLRLTRTGNQVAATYSTDGTTWIPLGGPVTMTAPTSQQDAGMIYTSHSAAIAGQATFSNFTVN